MPSSQVQQTIGIGEAQVFKPDRSPEILFKRITQLQDAAAKHKALGDVEAAKKLAKKEEDIKKSLVAPKFGTPFVGHTDEINKRVREIHSRVPSIKTEEDAARFNADVNELTNIIAQSANYGKQVEKLDKQASEAKFGLYDVDKETINRFHKGYDEKTGQMILDIGETDITPKEDWTTAAISHASSGGLSPNITETQIGVPTEDKYGRHTRYKVSGGVPEERKDEIKTGVVTPRIKKAIKEYNEDKLKGLIPAKDLQTYSGIEQSDPNTGLVTAAAQYIKDKKILLPTAVKETEKVVTERPPSLGRGGAGAVKGLSADYDPSGVVNQTLLSEGERIYKDAAGKSYKESELSKQELKDLEIQTTASQYGTASFGELMLDISSPSIIDEKGNILTGKNNPFEKGLKDATIMTGFQMAVDSKGRPNAMKSEGLKLHTEPYLLVLYKNDDGETVHINVPYKGDVRKKIKLEYEKAGRLDLWKRADDGLMNNSGKPVDIIRKGGTTEEIKETKQEAAKGVGDLFK